MNRTNWEHAGYAVIMQVIVMLLTGSWLAGTTFAIAFFIGREHAQRQDQLGYTFKTTFQAFDIRQWSLDAQLDLLFPVTVVLITYMFSVII